MAIASSWERTDRGHIYRLSSLAVALLLLAAFLFAFVAFLSPGKPDGVVAPVSMGYVEKLPLREPVYSRRGDFWLVRLSEHEVVAFVAVDPRPYTITCNEAELARMRAGQGPTSLVWDAEFGAFNQPGTFGAVCWSSRFAMDGSVIYGPSARALDQYPVSIDGTGMVTVLPSSHLVIKGAQRPR